MSKAYIDCSAGITPQKFFAAILDCTSDRTKILKEMGKLCIPFQIKCKNEAKRGLKGTTIELTSECEYGGHTVFGEIQKLVAATSLKPASKEKILFLFNKITEAESRVHRQAFSQVKLHEVGRPAAILSITGIIAGMGILGIEELYASPVSLGSGKIRCSHGILSVPAPATSELIRGIPVYYTETEGELTTPSGAAILAAFVKEFGGFPYLHVKKIGRGFARRPGSARSQPLTIYIG